MPILNWEEALNDELLYTGDSGADPDHHGSSGGQTEIEIVNADHPLAGGLPKGRIQVYSNPDIMSWGYPEVNAKNAIIVGLVGGDPLRVGLFGYEKGATLFDGFSTAAERRVMFFFNNDMGPNVNPAGFHLFDSSVAWLLRLPPPEPPATGGGEPAMLSVARSAGKVTLSWTNSGSLQQADAVTGPWSDAGSQNNPQDVSLTGTARFYRVRQ
ncbi:MAG: hypothetical protein O2960_12830 [Verrucomicrobia bacterium]|nr:hypothetical protein [Verrucomicrobiota bacterium]